MAARSPRAAAVCELLEIHDMCAAHEAGDERIVPAVQQQQRVWAVGDYEETDCIGGGVVQARCRVSGEIVAVKRGDGKETAGMMREAELLAICGGHPSVVALQALVEEPETGEVVSLVMEHAGPSLHEVLRIGRRGRPLREEEVRRVMRSLIAGVEHMHSLRVIHRDIKPAHILAGGVIGAVKICDLGQAVSLSEPPPYGRVGTRRYMAPEILLGKADYCPKVDMWSVGCVMAELLAGKPLFDGEDDTKQLLEIFDVLGVPFSSTHWPAYASLPLAGKVVTPPCILHCNRLRDIFNDHLLSNDGFAVLDGLLSCDIDRRLSAAAALKLPWFAYADVTERAIPSA
ncbi:hypothetical protein GUJ93_ZPchr0011g28504 [Zizania palustris]|uniref:[RNA-polymerase]-subunit kinase n=1 Tax=Zizania palustris TaxID=103762 RepID=A0A8J5WL45_ZIZPA|nr:hypothetical protein GUJ93_ZPchr0011g28504 [Zizania palustris]